jgi:signal recognition particle GTPase
MSWFQRLKDGLKKTKEHLVGQLAQVLQPGRRLDDELLSELEEILITADVGVDATLEIVQTSKRARRRGACRTLQKSWSCSRRFSKSACAPPKEPSISE